MLPNFKKIISVGLVTSAVLTTNLLADYHAMINNQQQGPFSDTQLQQMATDGSLSSTTMVWQAGMAGWETAGTQSNLKNMFVATPPPPLPGGMIPPPPLSAPTPPPVVTSNTSEESTTPNDLNEIQEAAAEFISSSEMTRDSLEAFAEKNNIEYGEEDNKGRTFYKAIDTVTVDVTNPQWAKWRVVAYKKAFAKIKQSFLESSYGNIAGDTLTEYASDDSDNRMEFPREDDPRAKSKTAEVWDKLVALSGAKLDAALKNLDIDPAEYNALPIEKRKNLFRNNFTEKSVKKAAGSLAGLMTVKTIEGKDSKGNYTIGVVAMYKKSLKQLAIDLSKGLEPMLSIKAGKQGRNVSAYIPKSKKALSQTFGVRLAFDETNSPILISYGQWSYMYKGKSQKKRDRGYEHALKKAKTESQKQIGQFMNSTAQFKEMEETSAIEEENAVLNPRDGVIRSEEVAAMVDKLSSTMKVSFKADLKGMKTKKTTSYKHPTGHEIVMVVSVWSQKNVDQTNNIRNFKHQKSRNTTKPAKKVIEDSSVEEGAGMDMDF